jgi:hypothetical protein
VLTEDQLRTIIAHLLHLWDGLADSDSDHCNPPIEKAWLTGWRSALETMEERIYTGLRRP